MIREKGGYTGGLAEQELIGEINQKERLVSQEYLGFGEAMDLVKKIQPGDPTDPQPRFANDLHATVCETESPDDYTKVSFYTAVGSPLDTYHGIDAFFEVEREDGRLDITSLDITKDPKKEATGYKADVVVLVPNDGLDPKEDKDAYESKIKEVADSILRELKFKRSTAHAKK